jgi:hypothetical protein
MEPAGEAMKKKIVPWGKMVPWIVSMYRDRAAK